MSLEQTGELFSAPSDHCVQLFSVVAWVPTSTSYCTSCDWS